MTEELYINGERVDVATSGITFTMKSNLFGELSKITAGNSQTIKLPRTVKNMRILDLPEMVSRDGGMVRRRLPAMLLRNGIPIVRDGEAVIVSVSKDAYEVGLTYGVVAFLTEVKDGGSLNDLPDDGEAVAWNKFSLTNDKAVVSGTYMPYGFAQYRNGVDDTEKINVHPMASLEWILQKIEARYGFTMQFGELVDGVDSVRGWLENKYIMLATKNSSEAFADNYTGTYLLSVKGKEWITGGYDYYRLSVTAANINHAANATKWGIYFDQLYRSVKITLVSSVDSVVDGMAMVIVSNYEHIAPELNNSVISEQGTDGRFTPSEVTITAEDAQGMNVVFYMKVPEGAEFTLTAFRVDMQVSYNWDAEYELPTVEYPADVYPIVANLPGIKLTDFIRMCGLLVGKFPILNYGEDDVIRFAGVEDLRANKGTAFDWSDKWDGEPTSISYTFLEARENIIDYENDSEVTVATRGVVRVDDDSLEKEETLAEIPLSGSNAVIPQYKLVDGELEEGDVSDRLLTVDEYNDATFRGLSFGTLMQEWYVGYRDVMRAPVVIKGTFRLTEIDIMQLDYLKPVYLRQMGRYYGIVQVQYKGDTSEVELIQI